MMVARSIRGENEGNGPDLPVKLDVTSFASEIEANRLFSRDESVVLGVSGGPDSTALLHLSFALRREFGWPLRIHVAHLNHMLRGTESGADVEFVQEACESLSVPCHIETVDVAALRPSGVGIEEAARGARFEFFERICIKTGAKMLALGHSADDQVETVLQRIVRGTGIRGLAGIPQRRSLRADSDVLLVRPLLKFRRAAIHAYLRDNSIAFRQDLSNDTLAMTRNRIRHVLVPLLEREFNTLAPEAILRLAKQASWAREHLEETARRGIEALVKSRDFGVVVLDADALSRKSRMVQAEIIRVAYVSLGAGEQDLSFEHIESVRDVLSNTAGNGRVMLPQGVTVEKCGHDLAFHLLRKSEADAESETRIAVPGQTTCKQWGIELTCECLDSVPELATIRSGSSEAEQFIDWEALRLPLFVRAKMPGDSFLPLGAPGPKSVSEYLGDAKVERSMRECFPILFDQAGVVWVVGLRLDERVRITERTTRAMCLRVTTL